MTWRIISDTTCTFFGQSCSESLERTPTTLAFQAGGHAGSVTIEALDSDYAEARVYVTVAGTPVDGGEAHRARRGQEGRRASGRRRARHRLEGRRLAAPRRGRGARRWCRGRCWQAERRRSSVRDASKEKDSGEPVEHDAAKTDAAESSGSSGGCAVAAPGDRPDLSAVGAVALGFASLVVRRRRRLR